MKDKKIIKNDASREPKVFEQSNLEGLVPTLESTLTAQQYSIENFDVSKCFRKKMRKSKNRQVSETKKSKAFRGQDLQPLRVS